MRDPRFVHTVATAVSAMDGAELVLEITETALAEGDKPAATQIAAGNSLVVKTMPGTGGRNSKVPGVSQEASRARRAIRSPCSC